MPDSTQSLILEELRSLREDLHAFENDTVRRVAVAESQLHALLGNGQPGRIAHIEKDVDELKQWKWWIAGIAAGAPVTVTIITWYFTKK